MYLNQSQVASNKNKWQLHEFYKHESHWRTLQRSPRLPSRCRMGSVPPPQNLFSALVLLPWVVVLRASRILPPPIQIPGYALRFRERSKLLQRVRFKENVEKHCHMLTCGLQKLKTSKSFDRTRILCQVPDKSRGSIQFLEPASYARSQTKAGGQYNFYW